MRKVNLLHLLIPRKLIHLASFTFNNIYLASCHPVNVFYVVIERARLNILSWLQIYLSLFFSFLFFVPLDSILKSQFMC